MIDVSDWLTPIEGESPSGQSLRDDGEFHELERLMEPDTRLEAGGDPEAYAQKLVTIDWNDIIGKATGLAERGKDLRLLVIVTRALANTDGYAGAASGIHLITQTLDQFWDTAHPQLREGRAPKEAALRRINALMQLQNDDDGLLADLEIRPALTPRGIGPISGRDLEKGNLDLNTIQRESPSGLSEAEKAEIAAGHDTLVNRVMAGCRATADQDPGIMSALGEGVSAAIAGIEELEAKVSEKLGDGSTISFTDFKRHLTRVKDTIDANAAPAGDGDAETETPVTNLTDAPGGADIGSAPQTSGGGAMPGRLNSRKDVEKCLDLIIDFYERTEPASPLPHIAKRMRRMVPMDFLELIEEVAPGGLKDFQVAVGSRDKK